MKGTNVLRNSAPTVLKIGGALLQEDNFQKWLKELAPFFRKERVVMVHGGGKEVSRIAEKLGVESRFVNGRRFTDAPMMEIVEMVLSGKMNPFVTGQLNALKIPAIGLSGRSLKIVQAKRVKELGQVGEPNKVNAEAIQNFLSRKIVPVFASIAEDADGTTLNINADEMASALAIALKAKRLILFTDVPGILDSASQTIPQITPASGQKLIKEGVITGGMIPKIKSSFTALSKGVGEIWILEGRLPLKGAKGTLLSKKSGAARHPFNG